MKFKNKIFFFIFIFIYVINISIQFQMESTQPKSDVKSDMYLEVQGLVKKLADRKMKNSNIEVKRRLIGILPEGYPQETVERALMIRKDRKRWNKYMMVPTELYRFCPYPSARVNYEKWCNNVYLGAKTKIANCLYNFCHVCCDHLVFIYQNAISNNIIGEFLGLKNDQGLKAVKDVIDKSQIVECKKLCSKENPVEMPDASMKEPPRDPELGTEKKPGLSCADIKKWGDEKAKNGQYWIKVQSKGTIKVFCDMEVDDGGWTLFFNYVHNPGANVALKNDMPIDLIDNSHTSLDIFDGRAISELRFMCIEKSKTGNRYWHFRSNHPSLISVARNGDQSVLDTSSISTKYKPLPAPGNIPNITTPDPLLPGASISIGRDKKGGFTDSPFGTDQLYWTAKGKDEEDLWECASNNRLNGDRKQSNSMVETHHSIWFRGLPSSPTLAKKRYLESL